jgi:hypothetical protein
MQKQCNIEMAIKRFNQNDFMTTSMPTLANTCEMGLNNPEYHFKTNPEFGITNPEQAPQYYQSIADLLWFIADFYLSAYVIDGNKTAQDSFNEVNTLFYNIPTPSLTEKGLVWLSSIDNT